MQFFVIIFFSILFSNEKIQVKIYPKTIFVGDSVEITFSLINYKDLKLFPRPLNHDSSKLTILETVTDSDKVIFYSKFWETNLDNKYG